MFSCFLIPIHLFLKWIQPYAKQSMLAEQTQIEEVVRLFPLQYCLTESRGKISYYTEYVWNKSYESVWIT